jgi:uncharacterized protein YpiB (UPF0302 family)
MLKYYFNKLRYYKVFCCYNLRYIMTQINKFDPEFFQELKIFMRRDIVLSTECIENLLNLIWIATYS